MKIGIIINKIKKIETYRYLICTVVENLRQSVKKEYFEESETIFRFEGDRDFNRGGVSYFSENSLLDDRNLIQYQSILSDMIEILIVVKNSAFLHRHCLIDNITVGCYNNECENHCLHFSLHLKANIDFRFEILITF